MTFNDALKLAIAEYGDSIFPNRAAFLCHLFATNGTGYDWHGGQLVSSGDGSEGLNKLAQIEQFVGSGQHKLPIDNTEDIPQELLRDLFDFIIPADIEERVVATNYNHWYPMSPGYNKLDCVPADANPDWINAAWECANLILTNGVDVDYELRNVLGHYDGDVAKATESINRKYETNCEIARKSIKRLEATFPEHKFEVNPAPVFDVNRKAVKGVKVWPLANKDVPYFDDIIDPLAKAIRFAYNVRRKNEDKDIPYEGYSVSAQCGSVEGRLTASSLRYDKEDQGRDALRVILAVAVQVGVELGGRLKAKAWATELNNHLRRNKYEHEDAIRKATDPLYKLRSEIAARLRDKNHVGPVIDESDPVQVEQLAIIKENIRKTNAYMKELLANRIK